MKENILKEKAYEFALRTVKLYQFLANEKKEYVMSKQVLRSGTSIGANIEEANQAQSKADFILRDSDFLTEKLANSLLEDCEEIQKLITSSIKTAKANLPK